LQGEHVQWNNKVSPEVTSTSRKNENPKIIDLVEPLVDLVELLIKQNGVVLDINIKLIHLLKIASMGDGGDKA
jgi:hypothetical protein